MADYDIGEAFREIENELIGSMTRNLSGHRAQEIEQGYEWAQWQVMQLEALEEYRRRNAEKMPEQFGKINDRIKKEIRTSYNDAQTAQEREILKRVHNNTPAPIAAQTGAGAIQGEFFKVNDRKLDALVNATTNDMQRAEYAVLRMTNDQYRSIIFNAQVYANTGAGTYAKAVDMATKDFLAAGINCIEYKNGRRVPIDVYADMALRTACKRAYLQGEGEIRKKLGVHTVIMNKRTNACPKCAPFAGKVIVDDVWSGGTKEEAEKGGYLLMSDCVAQGLYHPSCQDSHSTYYGDFLSDDEGGKAAEGEVSEDNDKPEYTNEELLQAYTPEEQERNVELYNAEQRENYCQRQVRRFERLEEFSIDTDNKREYEARLSEWEERLTEAEKAAEKLRKRVAIAAGSGIINEKSKKAITVITDKAIERVPNVIIYGYSAEQSSFIQKQHKELLDYSRKNNDNKEVAFVINGSLESESRKIFTGSDDQLDFGSVLRGNNLVVMHNHPRNSSFSTTDIDFFASNSNVKTLTIVKNNGSVETITKSPNFDLSVFQKEYNRLYKKIVKTNTDAEKEKFVKALLAKTKAGVIWNGN